MAKVLFCLMGPTASGKTDIACRLVEKFPFEIISVDSALIYRGMDIGSAKPDAATLAKAPHHLVDILNPNESYSAANFCADVDKLSQQIFSKGKIPLLVGGTMMYFRALQAGLSELPEANPELRDELLKTAETKGWSYMHQYLQEIDPLSATRIHPNDTQRTQRAIEVYRLTGIPLSELLQAKIENDNLQFVNLALMPQDRSWLHQRIGLRFKDMVQQGFIEEVHSLVDRWKLTLAYPSMRSVGYRQILEYLLGEFELALLNDKAVAATRQLAKRQLTWLRHWPHKYDIVAEDPNAVGEILAIIAKILDNSHS